MTRGSRTTTPPDLAHGPRLPRTLVGRRRLWEALDRADEAAVRVVVAPAGAGKTLGVAGWLRERSRRAHWLTADADLDEAALGTALDRAAAEPGTLLVIDDAHLLPPATIAALESQLNDSPDHLRLLLLTRWDLPLRRVVPEMLGLLTMLRGDLLTLDQDEAHALVHAQLPEADPEVVAGLVDRAAGWCAALVLLTRTVASHRDQRAAVRRLSVPGGIVDALAVDVVDALSSDERHVLLCTAHETQLTETSAVQLTGDPNAARVLAVMEADGFLVTRERTDDRTVFRVHPLLAEIAQRRMRAGGADVEASRDAVRRAAAIDRAEGRYEECLQRLLVIGDLEQSAATLDDLGIELVERGLLPWLAAFAAEHPDSLRPFPGAWAALGLGLWLAGDARSAQRCLDRVVRAPRQEPSPLRTQVDRATAHLLLAMLDLEPLGPALAAAVRTADSATGEPSARSSLIALELAIGGAFNWLGRWKDAEHHLDLAIVTSRTFELAALALVAQSLLALNAFMQGDEVVARSLAEQVLSPTNLQHAPPSAKRRARLVKMLVGLDDADWSDALAEVGAGFCDPLSRYWSSVFDLAGDVRHGHAIDIDALLTIPATLPTVPAPIQASHASVVGVLAHLVGDRGALTAMQRRLDQLQQPAAAALLAGLLAEHRSDDREALRQLEAAGRTDEVHQPAVRVHALVAAAQLHEAGGRHDEAMSLLTTALDLSEPRPSLHAFAGLSRLGAPVRPLLMQLRSRRPDSVLLGRLLEETAGFESLPASYARAIATPTERPLAASVAAPPLTSREREVLHELSRGSTYAVISSNLFVSQNTVKTHVAALYRKLGVDRRTAALATARSLGLI